MRSVSVLPFLIILSVMLGAQPTFTLEAANEAIGIQDHTTAAIILDSLEKGGEAGADFYLALGNARFETGRPAGAILAYERGLRLRPAGKKLSNNLRYVREESGIPVAEIPDFFLLKWWHFVGSTLGGNLAYGLSLLCWWVAVFGVLWWFLRRKGMDEKRRFALLPLAVGVAALAVVFFTMGRSRHEQLTRLDQAILMKEATLRVSPSAQGTVEGQLLEGEKVVVTDRVNSFVKVRLEDGRQGYLKESDLELL